MDRHTSMQLIKNSRRVTRFQVQQLRDTFPFEILPGEIRNMIYRLTFDLKTIERFFDKAFKKVAAHKRKDSRRQMLLAHKSTPSIFLLNKKIYSEASHIFRKSANVTFHHGLLDTGSVVHVISANILQQVSSITISDAGHPMIKGSVLPTSWAGYMDLLKDLGAILTAGHHLQSLTIDFTDTRLVEHMTFCYESDHDCGFRKQMSEALDALRTVRGIENVYLSGINKAEAQELTDLMKMPAGTFAKFGAMASRRPREVGEVMFDL